MIGKQPTAAQTSNYRVKSIETVMKGSDVQARVFTLAAGDTIPWHLHQASADHYFVLEGLVTIMTRHPEEARTIEAGADYRILPGTAHLNTNRSAVDCRFLPVRDRRWDGGIGLRKFREAIRSDNCATRRRSGNPQLCRSGGKSRTAA